MGKMTLSEIRKKVPDLQSKIEGLVKANEAENNELADIATAIEEAQMLYDLEAAKLAPIEDYVSKNKSTKSAKIQGSVIAQQSEIKKLKASMKKQKDIIDEKQKRREEITKDGSDYSKREAEAAECRKQIDEICDILVQDPTINAEMQKAVKIKFGEEIEMQNAKKDTYQKAKEGIIAGLKDDSKDGLKTLVEDLQKAKEEFDEATYDSSKDIKVCQTALIDAQKELVNRINSKFGVTVNMKDVQAMISALDSGKIDELSLPGIETVISEVEAEVTKLTEARDKTLERIESKKVVGTPVVTPEMEANQQEIDNIEQEIGTLDTEIKDIEAQVADINKQIKEKEEELGEPSEEYKDFQEAEKALKDEHIIPDDVADELLEKPEVKTKYEEFEKADLAVREAFQACKLTGKCEEPGKDENADRDKVIKQLQDAITNYQKVSEELSTLTGFDIESWHNYLVIDLNERAMSGDKTILNNSAYTHTNNAEFKLVLDDKEAMKGGAAIDEYEAVEDSLVNIDKAQEEILKGKSLTEPEKLFSEPNKGYFDLMDKFTEASGLEKSKGLFPGVTIYDLLKGDNRMSKKPLNRIKGFFRNIANKFRRKEVLSLPDVKQDVVDRYYEKKSEVSEEIASRADLEELYSKRDQLVQKSSDKSAELAGKSVDLSKAKDKRDELAKAAPAKSSTIEATEIDLMKVTYDETIVQTAIDKVERDDGSR